MRISRLKKEHIYLAPLAAAILLRLAVIPFLDISNPALMEYGIIARSLLSGAGYAYSWFHTNGSVVILPTAYMPPGQVFIQYGILSIFGNTSFGIIAIYFFQIIQTCIFIYILGKITFLLYKSEKAVVATIWLAAIYPPFIYAGMTFGVTTSALLLNSLLLYIAIRFCEALRINKKYLQYSLLLGFTLGLSLLFRGESPVIIGSTLILILYLNRKIFRQTLLYTILTASVALAILAPWTIRNYLVFDRLIPISTNGGFNFWRGNNAVTTGSPWTETGDPLWSTDEIWNDIEPHLDEKGDFDKVNSDVHSREALKWIRENPSEFIALALKKAVILWTVDIRSKMGGTAAYIIIYALTFAALVTGIFFIRRNKISEANRNARTGFQIIILWCVVMTLTAMIFFPLPRFQVLLIGIYFPVIGYGITEVALFFKRHHSRTEL